MHTFVFQNEDGSVKLTVVDVASYLKQKNILSALGTSVDSTPGTSAASPVEESMVKTFLLLP